MAYNTIVTSNKNPLLLTGGFKMVISRAPNTSYFLKSWSMPTVSANETVISRPQVDAYVPGSKLVYDTLSCTMMVSEDMDNYQEIYNWLNLCVKGTQATEKEKVDDVAIQILNSKNNPHKTVVFHNAFPIALGSFSWDVEDSDVTYATCEVVFRYDYFTFR